MKRQWQRVKNKLLARLHSAGRDLDAAAALDLAALDDEGRREAFALVEVLTRRAESVRDRIVEAERERGGSGPAAEGGATPPADGALGQCV